MGKIFDALEKAKKSKKTSETIDKRLEMKRRKPKANKEKSLDINNVKETATDIDSSRDLMDRDENDGLEEGVASVAKSESLLREARAKQIRPIANAKQQREKASLQKLKETAINKTGAEDEEWVPPVYSESRRIKLDLEKMSQNRCISILPDAPEAEYYKVLRTNIQQRTQANNWNTIMITSVHPGEGKTLTSINLSITFAKEFNQTVLLVDCDLRRPNIFKYLDVPFEFGIVDYLLNGRPLNDLILWPSIEKLTILSGKRIIRDSAELLGSPKMKTLVKEIKTRYDDRYVIFDVPPILYGADAIAFSQLVDCILVVIEEGRTSLKDVKKALEMIPNEKVLGFVLNRRKSPSEGYYYY